MPAVNTIETTTRTTNYKIQVKVSFIYKILAIGASFLLVPVMLHYLGTEKYGVWSTILTVISWVVFFDMGIGNGMRNKLAESLAVNNIHLSRNYISTTYFFVTLLIIVIYGILVFITQFINFQTLFNTTQIDPNEIKTAFLVALFFLLANFLLSLINQVAHACQKTSLTVLNQFLSNAIALMLIFPLSKIIHGHLVYLAITYGIALNLANIILSYYFYKINKQLIPQLKYFDRHQITSLISLGLQFFVIQLAVVIIFMTDKMIITQILGPKYVTSYDIVFKLFSIVTIIHGIIIAPLWSTYTEAFINNDLIWIKTTLKKLNLLMLPIIIVVIFMTLFAKEIIKIWIGEDLAIDNNLVIFMGIFVIISTWNNIYAYFLNGIGAIKIQLYSSIFAASINIPLSIFLSYRCSLGLSGIILATIISLSFFAILGPLQTFYILAKNIEKFTIKKLNSIEHAK